MNIKKLMWWFMGGAATAYSDNGFLYASGRSTTEIFLFFLGVGADSYVIERATDSGFTANLTDLSSEGYNGTDLTYLDTGLTIDTTYYYRVKAVKSGYTDSAWVTASAQTISVSPSFWYEGTGLAESTTNAYGKLTNNLLDNLYSIVNTSGPSLDFDTTKGAGNPADNEIAYYGFSNGNLDYWFSSTVSYAGDFTLAFRFKFLGTPVNHYLASNSGDATRWIRFQSLTAIQFRFGGGILSATFPTALVVGKWADVVIKRSGTTLFVSSDGGLNFSAGTASSGGTFSFETAFASDRASGNVMNGTFKRWAGWGSVLTQAQLDQFWNYEKQSTATEDALDALIPTYGLTYSDFTSYVVNNTLSSTATAGSYRTRVIVGRDKAFILLHRISDATYYTQDLIYVYDFTTNKISDPVLLGIPVNNTDVHNNGSIVRWGNRIMHGEISVHYDQSISTKLLLKTSGNHFNFNEITTLSLGNGVVNGTLGKSQYEQFLVYNNIIYCVFQEWNGTYAQWVSLGISYDGGVSWEKYRIVDSAGASEFVYPTLVFSETKLRVFIGWIAASNRYKHQTYLETEFATPYLWKNLAGSFSQDVRFNNPINRTNSLASCRVGVDASALAGNVKVGHPYQEVSGGEVWAIQGDGIDTALNLIRGTSGGSFTSQLLNFGIYSIITTWLSSDGDNLPFAVKTGADSFDIYVHVTNGGNWQIAKFTTTDGGLTPLAFDSTISQDDTKKHWRMYPAKNLMFESNKIVTAMRNQTTYGDLFVSEI